MNLNPNKQENMKNEIGVFIRLHPITGEHTHTYTQFISIQSSIT